MEPISLTAALNQLFPGHVIRCLKLKKTDPAYGKIICGDETHRHAVFWKILKEIFNAGLESKWESDKKVSDILISTDSLIFQSEKTFNIFKRHILDKLADDHPQPRPLLIPEDFFYKHFPEFNGNLTEAKQINTDHGKKILVLTFSDSLARDTAKRLIETKLTGEAPFTRKRKAVSLEMYESPSSHLSLNIEGLALLKLGILCDTSVVPSPKRSKIKPPDFSPDVLWEKYSSAIPQLKYSVKTAKMLTDCGREILHLTFYTKDSLERVSKDVKERLGNSDGIILRNDSASSYLRIQGVALLALNYLCHIPDFEFN